MAGLRALSSLLVLLVALGTPAAAQVTAEEAVETAREVYGPPASAQRPDPCPAGRPGEIVVCREVVEDDRYRVPSSTDDATQARAAVDDGLPRAPDVFGIPPCKAYQFCSKMGRTPAHPLLIDLKAIPEAPPGSDAARYSEGAMSRATEAAGDAPPPEGAPAP